MEQIFYVNVLFGKNKSRIIEELSKVIMSKRMNEFRFQIHPFRTNYVNEFSGNTFNNNNNSNRNVETLKNDIRQHLEIMNDINSSNIKSISKPFNNIIFINYTTKELEPAIKFGRIKFYLCDYINDDNIEIITMSNIVYINFMKKASKNCLSNINSVFMNYSTLVSYDTDSDKRIGNATSLDIGEETDDDITFILQTRLKNSHITDENGGAANDNNISLVLPYHPFRHSFFISIQNTKDNIHSILMSKNTHLIYYPFSQNEWLSILQSLMYERVLLNFLVNEKLYENESIRVHKRLYRNSVSYNYRFFKSLQKRKKTHILNEIVFNYIDAFKNVANSFTNWYNVKTEISISSQFSAVNVYCTQTTNGIFI